MAKHHLQGAMRRDNLERGRLRDTAVLHANPVARAGGLGKKKGKHHSVVTRGKVSADARQYCMLLKGRANPSRKTAVHRSACSANVQGAEYYEPQEEMLVGDQSFTVLNECCEWLAAGR